MQPIVVYTTSFCPYCVQAKTLLRRLNLDFQEVNLENDPELRQRLSQENNGYRTVPMIFFGKRFIGGYTELRALHDAGTLQKTLNE